MCCQNSLRTVPTFATAHTFCACRDGPRKSGFLTVVPAKQRYFCVVYYYAGKADLGEGFWDPNKNFFRNY